MGVRKITLNKVEMAQVVLTELIACVDVDEPRRAALRNALDLVTSLRPVADSPAQHTPVLWAPGSPVVPAATGRIIRPVGSAPYLALTTATWLAWVFPGAEHQSGPSTASGPRSDNHFEDPGGSDAR